MQLNSHTSNEIHLLPEHLIDQIKAGEVVEKPANVIKELIENSIDAKATEIKITIKNLGLDLISIEDNGLGIKYDDLPYAFCRHATSKISNFEDIYALHSFGFRGEALASIASISRISCYSKQANSIGAKIVINGGVTLEHIETNLNSIGTSIYINDLFYNTPVRLKFIRSQVSEKNSIQKILNSFFVNYPKIKFILNFEDQEKEVYPQVDNREERIKKIFYKKNKNKNTIHKNQKYLNNSMEIFLSTDSTKGYAHKHQYLFVNDRFFVDKKIHNIVCKNLDKIWGYGRYGNYALFLTIPPSEIDVNVHPNKTLVKFLKSNEILALVSATIKEIVNENSSTQLDNNINEKNKINQPQENIFLSQNNYLNRDFSKIHDNMMTPQMLEVTGDILFQSFPLNNQYLVINWESSTFLLSKSNLILSMIKKTDELTPLLITHPLKSEIINNEALFLRSLVDYGIELDRIDEHTLLLRSVPSSIDTVDYKQIVLEILVNGLNNFKNNRSSLNFEKVIITNTQLKDICENITLANLIENNIIKTISIENCHKLFTN